MNVTIRFMAGSRKGEEHTFDKKGIYRFGRDPECEMYLAESNVSRKHAQLVWDGVSLIIEDLKSTNGIFLNGLRIDRQILRTGDIIGIGSAIFKVESVPIGSTVHTGSVTPATETKNVPTAQPEIVLPPPPPPAPPQPVQIVTVHSAEGELAKKICVWLIEVQKICNTTSSTLMQQCLEKLCDILSISRALLVKIDNAHKPHEWMSVNRTEKHEQISLTLAQKIAESNRPQIIGGTSCFGIPVSYGSDVRGILVCDNPAMPEAFKDLSVPLIEWIGQALDNVLVCDAINKGAAVQIQAEQAFLASRRVQAQIFNREAPRSLGGIEWSIHYQPALDVGGDFYAFHEHKGKVYWIIGDMAGKGIGTALTVSMLKGLCKMALATLPTPADFLATLNEMLLGEIPQTTIITACAIQIDTAKGALTYANTGHEFGFVTRKGTTAFDVIQLPPVTIPLGLVPSKEFARKVGQNSLDLKQGDLICLFTDGVIEAKNIGGDSYGKDRLFEFFNPLASVSAERRSTDIFSAIIDFQGSAPQHDDMTLILGTFPG